MANFAASMKCTDSTHFYSFSITKVIYFIVLSTLFYACGPARHIKENQRLLTKVKVKSQGDSKYDDEIKSISKQQPNRRLLGLFKIYLGIYNLYYDKEDSKIKEKLGEAPVIYDSTINPVSVDLMSRFLNNKGYYENKVSANSMLSKKRAKLIFNIEKGPRYDISKLGYEISDQRIEQLFIEDSANSKLKVGDPFKLEALKDERLRIERLLKNNGYYKFSREYVVFEVDTFKNLNTAEINLKIKNPKSSYLNTDSLVEGKHQVYSISKLYVRMDYSARTASNIGGDTTQVDSVYFIDMESDKFNKKALSRITYIRPDDIYQLEVQEQTYRNLAALRVFSYVSIQYEPDYNSTGNDLIAYIDLDPRKKRSFTVETEGTNNGGNLGINGTITYQNNNTFKGAEILNISLSGGLEVQQILTDDNESNRNQLSDGFLDFNTIEFGPEISLEVPRFLLPFGANKFSPRGNPKTLFNASYNFQQRPDYERYVTETYVAYSWNETKTKTHIIQPFDLSYIKLNPSESFQEVLNDIQNPFLRNSYTDNFILALKYSFILNTKTSNRLRNYLFFRGNIESSGNLLSLVSDAWNPNVNEDGSHNVAGIRYAQYVRTDIDFRYYHNFNYNKLVYRFFAGVGIPYGNSIAMPFEKSFYAGGANGMRAWRARQLGPGTLPDSVLQSVDQIGNMQLEANVEFRFPITNVIEGAAFMDAGNIWNLNQDDSREETNFELDRLWEGTAIGLGLGVRLNFSFFIIRLDFAAPFKDPAALDPYELKLRVGETNLNLGIGYPF
ncbi:MAG: BamA/TamA family outer membrane protein [Vicingaceae bacterium]